MSLSLLMLWLNLRRGLREVWPFGGSAFWFRRVLKFGLKRWMVCWFSCGLHQGMSLCLRGYNCDGGHLPCPKMAHHGDYKETILGYTFFGVANESGVKQNDWLSGQVTKPSFCLIIYLRIIDWLVKFKDLILNLY